MSQAPTRVPDPDPAEIARLAAEIRQERRDDSRDDEPHAPRGGTHDNLSCRMQKALLGASFMCWRFHELEDVDR